MFKRIFDIVASILGLIIFSPLLLVIALLLKLRTPGPIFFCQERVGRNGRIFVVYKFRTMIIGHGGSTISVKGDSRITSLGAKLRRHKIDELPELWNVLKGEMSFVGPRPDVPGYINRLTGEERLILELRPGITSPASLKYANEEEVIAPAADPQKFYDEVIWPDKVRLNLKYYHNRSLLGDLFLIFRTIFKRQSNN